MQWLLTKILWGKQSKWQFLLAGGGFVAGLIILLISMQLYLDIEQVLAPQKSKSGSEFLVINKEISIANTLKISSSEFTDDEIDSLQKQFFVKKLGVFTSNQFESSVKATDIIPFRTVIFFEAVPDEFLDFVPKEWAEWNEQSDFVPMMVSQDFINLYNFGFALSQGLPQIPKESVKLVPLTLSLSGEKGQKSYHSRIVGFSDRIATVLVPEKFMRWANANIGSNQATKPSRLIIETTEASNPLLSEYLKKHNWTTNQDKLRAGQAGSVLRVIMSLIGFLGVFFISLSVVIFLMNFRLIIAEAQEEIRLLLQLGYKVKTLSFNLLAYFSGGLLFAGAVAWLGLSFAISALQTFMADNGLAVNQGIDIRVMLAALLLILGSLLVSGLSVWQLLRKAAQ